MKKVVYIDDDDDVRDVVIFAIESHGHKVESFENGRKGLEGLLAMKSDLPGLIICDYLMPEMDGLSFIHELRKTAREDLKQIPIAVTSAIGDIDQKPTAPKDFIFIKKPMDLEDLLKVVRDHCS